MAEEKALRNEFMDVVSLLREENERKEAEIKKLGTATGETKQAMDKMSDELVKASREIDELTAKLNRPAAPTSWKDDQSVKDFSNYMRKGFDTKGNYQISGNTTGGYTVPSLMADRIIGLMRSYDPVRQLARVINVSNGSPLLIPRITTNQTGGFIAETSTRTASAAAVFEQRSLTPHAVYTNVSITNALLEDSAFDMEQWIADECAKTLAYYEGKAFIDGNGNGQPYGLLNDATVLANYETAGNDVLTADSLVKLPFKLATQYLQGSNSLAYLMRRSVMAAALTLKEESTTGGYYFHMEPAGPVKWTFNGYPCYLSDTVPALGNVVYPAIFGDFKQYWIADVAGSMNLIRDPYTTKGYVVFHLEKRVGGQVADPAAFAVLKTS